LRPACRVRMAGPEIPRLPLTPRPHIRAAWLLYPMLDRI
jgi:hypothetical protein